MENQEHPDFDADAAFDEAAEMLEKGELTADNSPSDAQPTEQESTDHAEQKSDPQNAEPDLPEWLATATDEVKENFRKLQADNQRYQHQARSQNGRVGALTKKYQQAQAEIERLKQQSALSHLGDEMKHIEQDYPEVAQVIHRMNEQHRQQLAEYSKPLEHLAETQMQELARQQMDSSIDYVSRIVPDAGSIVASPQFATWLSRQPQGIQALYTSDDVNDAVYLLSEFKKTVSATAEKRTKQTQQFAAMALPNGRNAPKGGEELDEDALFNQIASQMKTYRY